ncbi:MAG: M16 family metallopeptidase [Desulfobacterales bacterium]
MQSNCAGNSPRETGRARLMWFAPCIALLVAGIGWLVPPGSAGAEDLGFIADWPHERSDLEPDPGVRFGRLPSGVRYVLMPNSEPRDRVVMHLVVQAGSLHESERQLGLAHFLEHLMFNGTTHFPPGELVKYFQSIGMQFGADANASTGFTETIYDVVLPEGSRESLEKGLRVLSDYAQGALLLESEIDRERGVVLAEKRSRDSAGYRTYVSTLAFEMEETLVPHRLPIGDERIIAEADRSDFKDFYDTWYRPERMIVVVVGDVELPLAEELVAEAFGEMKARAPARSLADIGAPVHEGHKAFYHHESEAGSTTVTIETIVRSEPAADSSELQQELMEELVANRLLQNRLDRIVSSPGSQMTSASAGSGIFLRAFRYAAIEADCRPENWEDVLGRLDQELRKALSFGFRPEELDRVRRQIEADLEQAVRQASTRESRRLAREILYSLRADRVFRSPVQERDFFIPMLKTLTPEQVHERLKKIWAPGHRLVLVTGTADLNGQASAPEAKILAVYDQSRKNGVTPPDALAETVFPYLPEPAPEGEISEEMSEEDLGITRIHFANGVHLLFKPTDFSKGEIQFTLSLGEGRSGEPAAFPGIADLAVDVINESGLGKLRPNELKRALAGTQTRVELSAGEDAFVFKGRSVPGEEQRIFELLYAYLRDPGFREEALALSLERHAQDYLAMQRSVDGAMDLYGDRFLAGGDRRFGLPAPEVVRRIDIAKIRSWMGGILDGAPLEIAVVGDFDPEAIRRWASVYLGGLPPRNGMEQPNDRGPYVPAGQRLDIQVNTHIDKGLLVMAFPTDDIWDIRRTRRLSVLAEVVSERVREVVREKLGVAYSPYAYNLASRAYPDYGRLTVVVPIDPREFGHVEGVIRDIADDLSRNGVSVEELKRSIGPTLTSIKDMVRRNGYWTNTVLKGASRNPEQIDWSRTIQSDYASITPGEISDYARTYLDTRKLSVVTVRPPSS